jgi:hypothetical protein
MTSWSVWHQQVFLQSNLGWLLGVFINRESWLHGDEYNGESQLHGGVHARESRLLGSEYTKESIMNTNNEFLT